MISEERKDLAVVAQVGRQKKGPLPSVPGSGPSSHTPSTGFNSVGPAATGSTINQRGSYEHNAT